MNGRPAYQRGTRYTRRNLNMSVFADRLKTAMQQTQISSAQLSKQTGIGRSSISQWLSSKYVAKYDKVVTLATALAVDPEWLSGATDEPATTEPAVAGEVDAALVSLWQQLDAAGQQKLLNKAQKLVAKQGQPDAKRKKKGKKKKNKKRKKTRV